MSVAASAGPTAGAWQELAEAVRGNASERTLLRELLEILSEELGASVARVVLSESGGLRTKLAVRSRREPAAGAESLTIPFQGGEVFFEGIPKGASERLDGLRATALGAALRAFSHSEDVKRHRFEVNYRGVALDALYDVGLAIAATLNLEELSEAILLRAVSLLDARRGAFYRFEDDDFLLERTLGGSAVACVSQTELERALSDAPDPDVEILPGSQHLLAVPIRVENDLKGLLVVADKESRAGVGPFAGSDRQTLELFANQAAIALENAYLHRQALEKERLEREGELAAGIQRRLLPEITPQIDGYELTGWNRSARMVGGDYYNYLQLEEGKYFIVLADVTGKGMPAALLVSTLDSALRLLLETGLRDTKLLAALNEHIFASSASNTFITLVAVEIETASGNCRYLSAGHNPSLWLSENQPPRWLDATGLPIGLFSGATYSFDELNLAAGDLLCLYSDGITECLSPAGEEYGVERLAQLLAERCQRPLLETADSISSRLIGFEAAGPRGDDQTVVLLRRR